MIHRRRQPCHPRRLSEIGGGRGLAVAARDAFDAAFGRALSACADGRLFTVIGDARRDGPRLRAKLIGLARARDIGLERMAEETVEIADDSGLDVVMTEDGPRADGEVVQRAKLRVDTRKWLLSKLAPKRYGDRLQVDATVAVSDMDNRELVSTLQELATRLGVVLPDWITAIAKQEGTGE